MKAIHSAKISPSRWPAPRRLLRLVLMPLLLALFANGVIPARAEITSATFAPKIDFATNPGPVGVAIGDLDGDGKSDIASANYGSTAAIGNTVSVLRNTSTNGNVSYAPKVDFLTGNGPHAMAQADLDGDGKLDLVTANTDAYSLGTTLSVLRNTSTSGTISFAPKVDLTTGTGPAELAVGDLDGDGKLDLAATNWDDGRGSTLSVFRNTSSSGTLAFDPKLDFTTGLGPHGIAIDDVDGDGRRDVAVVNFGAVASGDGNTVSILRNTSTVGNLSLAPKVDFTTDTGPRDVVLTDFDGDGKQDLATSNFGVGGSGNTVSVLRNLSTSGTLSFGPKSDLGATSGPLGLVSGDLDGDSQPDLAVTNYGSTWPMPVNLATTVSVFENTSVNGVISFMPKVDFAVGNGPHALDVGDVNQDNKGDLAVVNYDRGNGTLVSALLNTTGVIFNTPTFTNTPLNTATATNTPLFTPTATSTAAGNLLFDDFLGSGLSSSWFARLGTPPSISGGLAVFNAGDSIESNATFGDAKVFEIKALYSSSASTGLCWTNADVSNYACWVPMSSNLSHFAFLSNTGGQVDSGVIVPSGFHQYAISHNGTTFTVYMDGVAVYSAAVIGLSVDHAFLSGYGGFSVDWACVYAAGSSCQGTGTVIPTNTPTNTATSASTSTATNTPTNTATATNTPLFTPTATGTAAGDVLFDDFLGSALSSSWFARVSNPPSISGGLAVFSTGNSIESNAAFGDATAFEIQAQYSLNSFTGLCWTNADVSNYVCWVPRSSDPSHFAWFTNADGEVDSGLLVPPGYHRYAISRSGTTFTVYIDGAAVYSAAASGLRVDHAFLSGYGGFAVDWACVYSAGSFCQGTGTVMPTNTPTNTATNAPTSTGTNTPTNTPTASNTPTRTPTASNTPTRTPTPSNTPTRTATPTNTPVSTNTGWLNPSANAAQPGGDGNGYETSPTNAYTDNNIFAVDVKSGTNKDTSCTSSGKDKHSYYNYNVAIPGTVVDGIEVRLDARADSTIGSPQICIQLSWDGGATWTNVKSTSTLTTSQATYILGSASDNWGRTWTISNLSNSNFRVRIIDVASSTARDFSLDWIAVRVTYH